MILLVLRVAIYELLLLPLKVKEVMFSPVCLFLSVCVQDIAKSCGRIRMKICGQVRRVTRPNRLDFGEYPDPDLATRIFEVILQH